MFRWLFNWLIRRPDSRQEQLAASTRELQQFVLALQGMSDEELGNVVAMAAVVRMSMRAAGGLPDETLGVGMPLPPDAETKVRRTMVQTAIAMQRKNHDMAPGAMVWVHTLRAYYWPTLRLSGREMWGALQRGFPHALAALSFMESMTREPPPTGTALATQFIPVGLESVETAPIDLGEEIVANLNRNALKDTPTS